MGNGRSAGDDHVGPCPWLLQRHERQFLGHPQVPERDGGLVAAVSLDTAPLRFGLVGLHPDHRVGHGLQLAPCCPGTFDDHQVAVRRDFYRASPVPLLPGRRPEAHRLAAVNWFQDPADEQASPVEHRLTPRDVVGVHHS
jgi:hypothetical protein